MIESAIGCNKCERIVTKNKFQKNPWQIKAVPVLTKELQSCTLDPDQEHEQQTSPH